MSKRVYPQRKSPRLQGYDYSQSGGYFVTICTYQRHHLFGHIDGDEMYLNSYGKIAAACWRAIPEHYRDVELDIFVVMPNHIHGILFLHTDSREFRTLLGCVINAYKGAVTARIRQHDNSEIVVWQGQYHDHIIRNEADWKCIHEYVQHNSALWVEDVFYADGG